MKKIKSIYWFLFIFLVIVLTSFGIIYSYSTFSLENILVQEANIQMEYVATQLKQKITAFELEADYNLNSEEVGNLQSLLQREYDSYEYITAVTELKDYLVGRQKSNVGIDEFLFYWKKDMRAISTRSITQVNEKLFELEESSKWFIIDKEVYFCKEYENEWNTPDDELYLVVRLERDFLYKLKNMTSPFEDGGTLLVDAEGNSLFSTNEMEEELLEAMKEKESLEAENFEISCSLGKYQIVRSELMKNGLRLISYYPLKTMMYPIRAITWIAGLCLLLLLMLGCSIIVSYDNNIVKQLNLLTKKLKQVEEGDFSTQIITDSENEFTYVFNQFNDMVVHIRQLMDIAVKEQQLRYQVELHQLQVQIQPHFLYNCLSYIVTVADRPEAVTEMAVHLSDYYRYSTRKKSITTIGEEAAYARAYLKIMEMRKKIDYTVTVAEELHNKKIIPLILQPIIENAIEHAIEERENATHIYVKIYKPRSNEIRFEVSDDGNGLSEEQIQQLMDNLAKKERNEYESVGLWNVNQRLVNYYEEDSKLYFEKSVWGGLKVSFTIYGGGEKNDSINCG